METEKNAHQTSPKTRPDFQNGCSAALGLRAHGTTWWREKGSRNEPRGAGRAVRDGRAGTAHVHVRKEGQKDCGVPSDLAKPADHRAQLSLTPQRFQGKQKSKSEPETPPTAPQATRCRTDRVGVTETETSGPRKTRRGEERSQTCV